MSIDPQYLIKHFQIQSAVDLDFIIGQERGYPVGMQRSSPLEFRRRIIAAAISYQLQLASVDYTLKRYVKTDAFEDKDESVGDATNNYLSKSAMSLKEELKKLHTTENLTFGVFGAEVTLYRIPHALDTARILSNRGLLLEVVPILRVCLEMTSWANVAFQMQDEAKVRALDAPSCISQLKRVYRTAGKLYGYLSKFSHWGHVIHSEFLSLGENEVAVVDASIRYRAISLALCLVMLDVLLEVVRFAYGKASDVLIIKVQGVLPRDATRTTYRNLSEIASIASFIELQEIKSFLPLDD